MVGVPVARRRARGPWIPDVGSVRARLDRRVGRSTSPPSRTRRLPASRTLPTRGAGPHGSAPTRPVRPARRRALAAAVATLRSSAGGFAACATPVDARTRAPARPGRITRHTLPGGGRRGRRATAPPRMRARPPRDPPRELGFELHVVTDNPHAWLGQQRPWPFAPPPVPRVDARHGLEIFVRAAWPDAVAGAAPAAPRPVR
jgi:hypothetical protein